MTSYGIQGATNDASTSVITEGVGAAELLVNLTRGRNENVLYAIGTADDEFDQFADRDTETDLIERLGTSVRVADQATVADVDAASVEAARRGLAGHELNQLHHTTDRGADDALLRARQQRHTALALAAKHAVPAPIEAVLGPKPDIVWAARQWERLAARALAYIEQHQPTTHPNPADRVDHLLGKPASANNQDREQLAGQLRTYISHRHTPTRPASPTDVEVGL